MSCNNCSSCSCKTEDVQEVQELTRGTKYALGTVFKIGNSTYKVVTYRECKTCDFVLTSYCNNFSRVCVHGLQAILYDTEE